MSDFASSVLHNSSQPQAQSSGTGSSAFAHITYGFVGKFLGYCLYMHCRVPVNLSPYLYKCLC